MKNWIKPPIMELAVIFPLIMFLILGGCVPTAAAPTPTPTRALPSVTAVPPTQPPASPTPSATAVSSPTVTSTPPPTNTPLPTNTTTLQPTNTPTNTPAPDVFMVPAGEVAFAGVQFQLDGRLAAQIYPMEETWGEMTYTVFKFGSEGICREVGCIEVYDVAAYEAENPDFPLPPVGAATLIRAQRQPVAFENGSGTRAVLMRGQDGYFANNEALLYEYQGFTADGRFYLLVTIPIDAPILLTTYDPALNQNPDAIPIPVELPADYLELSGVIFDYNQEIRRQLDLLTASDFMPDLTLLDELVASVWVDTAVSDP